MRQLPTGTVTFLFTDVEGSTRLLHELGEEEYAKALAAHRRVLREAFAAHGGVEVDTQGDAFFVAFPTARGAVGAAAEAQATLAIPVRMGVHTGTPVLADDGYVGVDVHRAARIAAAGHGGQVLVSSSTRALVDAADLSDLGEHRFKDLAAPERVYQLGDGEFPPLASLYRTNLPIPSTPFLGREREVSEVAELLGDRDVRVLTLSGPGGTGKTRLALQAAAEAAERYQDGVWWVQLAAIRDPSLVLPTVAQVLEAKEQPGRSLVEELSGRLTGKRVLLVIDNAEHLLPSLAGDVAALVEACGTITLLVTSRESLQIRAEREFRVASFDRRDAVVFFRRRAMARDIAVPDSDAVHELCRRLDDLPLALELASARLKVFSPEQLLERLGERLDLLRAGRDADARQQTLRATIAWSYELLNEAERQLFARLSVFAAGCEYDAVEEVCGGDADTVQSLVDKSLVRHARERFTMLETIREYALERLGARSTSEVRDRKAAYLLHAAMTNAGRRLGDMTDRQMEWFEVEYDNVRDALDWLEAQRGEAEPVARLVVACHDFWVRSGRWREGRQRTEAVLARLPATPSLLRAQVLVRAAQFAWRLGDYARAAHTAASAVACLDQLGENGGERLGATVALAVSRWKLGEQEQALVIWEAAAKTARATGDERGLAIILNNMGNAWLDLRDFGRAGLYLEESAAISRRAGLRLMLANNLVDLGFVALAESRFDDAGAAFREGIGISRTDRLGELTVWSVEGLAAVALAAGRADEAARLLGAASRPRNELGYGEAYYTLGDESRARTIRAARAQLGDDAFDAAWAVGERLTIEEACETATLVD